MRRTLRKQWVKHVIPSEARLTACWGWKGSLNSDGYGQLKRDGRQLAAHRVAWELADGKPVPEGLRVLHTCDTRSCTRNDDRGTYLVGDRVLPRWGHLFLGTQADNMADMRQKGRARGQRQLENGLMVRHRSAPRTKNRERTTSKFKRSAWYFDQTIREIKRREPDSLTQV